MMVRLFLLLLGFGLAVAGGVTMILFLNLIPIGYDYVDYLEFIIRRPESYLLVVGLILMWASMAWPTRNG